MIRVAVFLAAVGSLALGIAWFADRPGDVTITWLGWRIETSVMVAGFALIAVVLVSILLWTIVRGILRSPDQVSLFLRNRRSIKGYLAISRGLIAVGAGDVRLAQKSANEAERLAPHEPLALLLSAQSAQLSGERSAAERAFRAMAGRDDTKLIGLRGLYVEARRREDAAAARLYAEEAVQTAPDLTWAGQAVLDFRCAAADWAGALDALDHMKDAFEKDDYRRQRAVLLTARALAIEESERDAALSLALEAVKLAPSLVPAAALAGRRLAEAGSQRKAAKILEAAWKANPHPDLADAYAHLRYGDSALERLVRVQKLAEKGPPGAESALAVARAAADAREFSAARAVLAPYLSAPTQRVAALMGEIEETEHADEGRARQWMARAVHAVRDPAWTADGFISDKWMPVSPVTGRLDAFQWKVPLAEIGMQRPVIEADTLPASRPRPAAEPEADLPPPPAKPVRRAAKPKDARPPEAVIPLVHAPDDPGPDSRFEPDPVPEPTTPPSDRWRRIREFFGQ
jgi:HemY protein